MATPGRAERTRGFPAFRGDPSSACAVGAARSGEGRPSLASDAADGQIVYRIFEQLPYEIVVLDADGIVVFCNARARRLIAARTRIAMGSAGHLHFLDRTAERRFRLLLQNPAKTMRDGGETLDLEAGSGESRCVASLRLLETERPAEEAHFFLTFSELGVSPPEDRMRHVMASFGLTPAEQRLTRFLSAGGRLSAAAAAFGLSRHTVRNQLRAIFDKVGVRRQAELTRILWGGCSYAVS
jgi:DNA-binding CsgD family transcriptional regulator